MSIKRLTLKLTYSHSLLLLVYYYAPDRREGGNKRCFCPSVCPSVCLSVCPSRTKRIIREPKGLACPNLEGRFPTLDATRTPQGHTVKGQGWAGAYRVGRTRRPHCLLLLLLVVVVVAAAAAAATTTTTTTTTEMMTLSWLIDHHHQCCCGLHWQLCWRCLWCR